MSDKKKFGLLMPKKPDASKIKKHFAFEDDSDEDERVHKRPKIPQKKMESINKLKTDSVEDPSVYEYDSIYEDMKRKRMETIVPKEKKNSRYIETLLKAAEKRKKEYERRMDKKIQTEREKEGDKFRDKEAFVTSSYKKRMLEQEEEEEKERHENMLNDMMDVAKQNDLSGFYRHFLKQSVGEEMVPTFGERQIKEEVVSNEESSLNPGNFEKYEDADQDSDNIEISDSENPNSDGNSHAENQEAFSDSRSQFSGNEQKTFQFRKRYNKSTRSPSLSSSENEKDNLHTEKSICFSKKFKKNNSANLHNSKHDSYSLLEDNGQFSEKNVDAEEDCNKNKKESKVSIFAKRTIGDTFADAQARYFQRIAQKTEM